MLKHVIDQGVSGLKNLTDRINQIHNSYVFSQSSFSAYSTRTSSILFPSARERLPDRLWRAPSPYLLGTLGSFTRFKWAGCEADYSAAFSTIL